MFESFQKSFLRDPTLSIGNIGNDVHSKSPGLEHLLDQFGGDSFNNGLYRVVRSSDVSEWNARVTSAFPEFDKKVVCFGFDWLGRVFAIDHNRYEGDQPAVVMFEPGTGEALEIPCNIASFHDEELIEYADAALASDFQKKWLSSGGRAPHYGQCVGYKKPLFLGGVDDLSNLEMSDINVYWHILGQLIAKTKNVAPGTKIQVNLN